MELNRRAEDAEDAAPPPPPPAAGVCMWRWAGGWPGARQARRRRGIGAAQGTGPRRQVPRSPPGTPRDPPPGTPPAAVPRCELFFNYFLFIFLTKTRCLLAFLQLRGWPKGEPLLARRPHFFFSINSIYLFIYFILLIYLFWWSLPRNGHGRLGTSTLPVSCFVMQDVWAASAAIRVRGHGVFS